MDVHTIIDYPIPRHVRDLVAASDAVAVGRIVERTRVVPEPSGTGRLVRLDYTFEVDETLFGPELGSQLLVRWSGLNPRWKAGDYVSVAIDGMELLEPGLSPGRYILFLQEAGDVLPPGYWVSYQALGGALRLGDDGRVESVGNGFDSFIGMSPADMKAEVLALAAEIPTHRDDGHDHADGEHPH